jgi:hypothetical protein
VAKDPRIFGLQVVGKTNLENGNKLAQSVVYFNSAKPVVSQHSEFAISDLLKAS